MYKDFNHFYSSSRGTPPCQRDCSERSADCHAKCKSYLESRKRSDKLKEKDVKRAIENRRLNDIEIERRNKSKKKRNS